MKISKSSKVFPDLTKEDTIKGDVLMFPKYIFGGSFKTSAERQYEGWYKGYRVIAILTTRRKGDSWGKGKLSYQIDGERKFYKTSYELMTELDKLTLKVSA